MGHNLAAWCVKRGLKDRFVVVSLSSNSRREELISGLVARQQDQAPNEIRKEPPNQDNDEHRQTLPEFCRAMLQGECLDRITGRQAVSKASTHHTRKQSDPNAFAKVEFLNRGLLLFRRHNSFFRDTRESGCCDASKTDENSEQDHAARRRPHDQSHELPTENWRHQSAERGAKPKHDRHSERKTEIAHR